MSVRRGGRPLGRVAVVLLVQAAALTLLPARAWAGEPTAAELREAKELFAAAERDEGASDFKAALEKLERAAKIKTTAGIRFHIALCRESLGDRVGALAAYEAAAAQARAENVGDVLEAVREPLADLRARVPTLSLSIVNASSEDVVVSLDGRPLAPEALTTPLRLAPGTHRVVARRKVGPESVEKVIDVKERDAVALDLRVPTATPAKATALPAPAPASHVEANTTRSSLAPIVATAGAAVLVVGGTVSFFVAGAAQDAGRSCTSVDDCETQRTRVRTWDALALGGWVGGAAVSALAAVLWVQSTHVSVTAGPSGAAVGGRF